ncbi:MAG TPA: ArsC family reductase [Chromatiales bacterium]|nr:ArsC family reductase [Chromatiales bacterium]
MVEVYGIPNCDTMKKARKWLADHGVAYRFHDYKKEGVDKALLDRWIEQVGWETLLNRRGMMWRKLPQDVRDHIDAASARRIMRETPSILKRPVLVKDGKVHVGFDPGRYETLFG